MAANDAGTNGFPEIWGKSREFAHVARIHTGKHHAEEKRPVLLLI